eukprot:TRINITY_DN101_c0_g2_i8.p2 TRINITY_DN101_c0_g2~~TRINITY_DN101_c0_g2_i8.p2  ORF type:complete len:243 (-),score=16.93 TRINITY_DN101_c0_g2_i8:699-1427(-)
MENYPQYVQPWQPEASAPQAFPAAAPQEPTIQYEYPQALSVPHQEQPTQFMQQSVYQQQQPTEQVVATGLVPVTVDGQTFYVQQSSAQATGVISPDRKRQQRRCLIISIVAIVIVVILCAIVIPVAIVASKDDNDYDGEITYAYATYDYSYSYSRYSTDFTVSFRNTGKKGAYFTVEIWDGSTFLDWDWNYESAGGSDTEYIYNVREYYSRAGTYDLKLKVHPSGNYYDDGELVDTYSVTSY